jgi:hypothetical protein
MHQGFRHLAPNVHLIPELNALHSVEGSGGLAAVDLAAAGLAAAGLAAAEEGAEEGAEEEFTEPPLIVAVAELGDAAVAELAAAALAASFLAKDIVLSSVLLNILIFKPINFFFIIFLFYNTQSRKTIAKIISFFLLQNRLFLSAIAQILPDFAGMPEIVAVRRLDIEPQLIGLR